MKNNIRIQRAILDISQEELAKAVGCSRNTINVMEGNSYVPSTLLAMRIARYFGRYVEEIFEFEAHEL